MQDNMEDEGLAKKATGYSEANQASVTSSRQSGGCLGRGWVDSSVRYCSAGGGACSCRVLLGSAARRPAMPGKATLAGLVQNQVRRALKSEQEMSE